MTIKELAKRYAEKPTDERYKALRDKIYEEEQPTMDEAIHYIAEHANDIKWHGVGRYSTYYAEGELYLVMDRVDMKFCFVNARSPKEAVALTKGGEL